MQSFAISYERYAIKMCNCTVFFSRHVAKMYFFFFSKGNLQWGREEEEKKEREAATIDSADLSCSEFSLSVAGFAMMQDCLLRRASLVL